MYTDTIDISYFRSDAAFDTLYPEHIRRLSEMHWTALDVALEASNFLAQPGGRVLDIGSGVGKFCIAAGMYHPSCEFYGVERRIELFNHAERARIEVGTDNVHFIPRNMTELNYDQYDHFYFYNPFYENIEFGSRIDYSVKMSFEHYQRFSMHVREMLRSKPTGTRIVTYHAPDVQIPAGYHIMDNSYNRKLKLWEKI